MQEYDMASLNDCNDGKRGSDVLMLTLEKCQKIVARNVELEKKLRIATEALNKIINYNCVAEQVDKYYYLTIDIKGIAEQALRKIKE